MDNPQPIRESPSTPAEAMPGAAGQRADTGARGEGGTRERLENIDILRGLVMAVMALDHARDYFSNVEVSPTDLSHGSVSLFLTRWVTHLCAPVFFLLAGTGAYLSSRKKLRPQLAHFLLTRGAFLVLLELTVVRVGWDFNLHSSGGPIFGVFNALGVSMIALAGLIYLPPAGVAAFGVALIVLHNLADDVSPEQPGAFGPLWAMLHVQGPVELGGLSFYVSYPLIPWIGVMALGYSIGPLFESERRTRRRRFLLAGMFMTVAFLLLRATNSYGDPDPWGPAEDLKTSFLSFMNVTKYPPSLQYLLMTLGPALVLLAAFDRSNGRFVRALIPLGRTALFFYVLHLYLIHGLALGLGAVQGFEVQSMCVYYTDLPNGYGVSLPVVYLLWLSVVAALYPLCCWYAAFKKKHRDAAWLSYL